MAQSPASPTPNVLKPPIAVLTNTHVANPLFYPRKEFLRDQQRVVSSFSLLTLAGHGFVRLYSFPDSVIIGLRKFFDQHELFLSCRESPSSHFFEFSLDHKPWANTKNLLSEKLIVAILSIIFQYGYTFISTIEYAREQDDRIALAFSRPTLPPVNSSIPIVPSGSVSTLPQAGSLIFAISFPSTAILRVIEPPLSLTPAILQSVRNAWPRGVADEKRIGDSYEFKLKGYRWFQENTFAIDSLQQILSLLTALDRHSFTLLTSLTLGKRSRTRDFWIFAGPLGDNHPESPPASPAGSSLELKREITPQHGSSLEGHIRATCHTSSPLKQVTPSHSSSSGKLRKPLPKAQLPVAFRSDTSLNNAGRLSSEIGSVDMTGIGTLRKEIQPQTPDVFYATGPTQASNVYQHQQEFNPWGRSAAPPTPSASPPTSRYLAPPFGRQHSRHYSMSSADDPLFRGSVMDSPYDAARPPSHSSSSNNSRLRRASSPLASSPLNLYPQSLHVTPTSEAPPQPLGEFGHIPRYSGNVGKPNNPGLDIPRIPTPPLLGPGAFRDSAFSSATGWRSTEVPIAWTGKDLEPFSNGDAYPTPSSTRIVPLGPRERRSSSGARTELQPLPTVERRGSSGPVLPGAWTPTPKEEKRQDDVVRTDLPLTMTTSASSSPNNLNTIPPTIKEQPSQEGEEIRAVKVRSPEQHTAADARKSEAAWVGNTLDRNPSPPNSTMPKSKSFSPNGPMSRLIPPTTGANGATLMAVPVANGSAHPKRPTAPRRNSISEGWVIVRIAKGEEAPPPMKHSRSHSDSHVPTIRTLTQGAARSTNSPAPKAIVAADAINALREKEKKEQSGGIFRHFPWATPKGKGPSRGEANGGTTKARRNS